MLARLAEWRLGVWMGVILLLTAVTYAPTVRNDFVDFDDVQLIVENGATQELSTRTLRYAFTTFDPELYIPLTLVSYQVEGAVMGLRPGVVHATNLFLHLLNVALVGLLAFGLTRRKWVAVAVTTLFALHPLNSEAVLWASGRKDLLSAFFFLASFVTYLRYRRTGGWLAYLGSIVLFTLALFSKVSVAPLPLLLLLTDWLEGDRLLPRLKEKIPFFLLSVVFLTIALFGKATVLESSDFTTNVLLGFKSIAFYLWKIVVPLHFSVIYPQPPLSPASQWPFVVFGLVTVALLAAAVGAVRRFRFLTWGIAFFLLLVIPSFTNFFKNGALYFASDRYAYLPAIGIFLIIVLILDGALRRQEALRLAATIILACAVLGLGWVSHGQVDVWRSSGALYQHVLALYPDSVMAHHNLGVVLSREGKFEDALTEYERASEIDPQFVFPLLNTSKIFRVKGDFAREEQFLRAAVQVVSKKTIVLNTDLLLFFALADFLTVRGRNGEALDILTLAAKLGPRIAAAHYELGKAYQERGRSDDALKELELSRSLQSHNADMQYRLSSLYAERGRLPEAEKALEWVLWLNPGYPKAEEHLENIRRLLTQ